MVWVIVLGILAVPFVLARFFRYLAVRVLLTLFWLGCAVGGAWFLREANKAEKDLEAVQTYVLPHVLGTHRITILPTSQKSMKAVLRGVAATLTPADLKRLEWNFRERFVSATWFEPKQHDEPQDGDTLLFYVDYWGTADGPLTLEYQVGPETAGLLGGRSLVVGHDGSARHMIRDHLLPMLYLFGWGLVGWGVLWMVVQAAFEIARQRRRRSSCF